MMMCVLVEQLTWLVFTTFDWLKIVVANQMSKKSILPQPGYSTRMHVLSLSKMTMVKILLDFVFAFIE